MRFTAVCTNGGILNGILIMLYVAYSKLQLKIDECFVLGRTCAVGSAHHSQRNKPVTSRASMTCRAGLPVPTDNPAQSSYRKHSGCTRGAKRRPFYFYSCTCTTIPPGQASLLLINFANRTPVT